MTIGRTYRFGVVVAVVAATHPTLTEPLGAKHTTCMPRQRLASNVAKERLSCMIVVLLPHSIELMIFCECNCDHPLRFIHFARFTELLFNVVRDAYFCF